MLKNFLRIKIGMSEVNLDLQKKKKKKKKKLKLALKSFTEWIKEFS